MWGAAGALGVVTLLWAGGAVAERPSVRYDHAVHAKLGVPLNCEVCHKITPEMRPTFPGADDHKPCANEACHKMEFAKRESTFCFACHARNEPWGENPIERRLDGDEFAVAFSHANHLDRAEGGKLLGQGCATCHPTQAGKVGPAPSMADPAPQHRWCGSCHQQLAEPPMQACGGCHKLGGGPAVAAAASQPSDRWRVAAKFEHDTHRMDVRTATPLASPTGDTGWARFDRSTAKTLDCEACHANMATVGVGDAAARPGKPACETCHAGERAFKVTGFGCATCHGPSAAASKPGEMPASQPGGPPGGSRI